MLFAFIVTYVATQAHGWAGGVATQYWQTTLIGLFVTAISHIVKKQSGLLALALFVQLAVHFGTGADHSNHHMTMSANAMTFAHIASALIAWLLLINSEKVFGSVIEFLASIATSAIQLWSTNAIILPKHLAQTDFRFVLKSQLLQHYEGRGPPVFS
jgi:hypothetical protein